MCCSFLLTCFQKKCTRQLDGPRWSVLNKPRMRYVNKNATCKISFQGEKSLLKVHPRHQVLGRLTAVTPLLGQRSIHPSQRRENKIWINAVVCGASPPLYLHAGITRSPSISLIIFCHFRLCSMKLGRHFFPPFKSWSTHCVLGGVRMTSLGSVMRRSLPPLRLSFPYVRKNLPCYPPACADTI